MKIQIILFLLLIIIAGGCKEKGCTDPKAINYISTANEDDGSCILCKYKQDSSIVHGQNVIDDYPMSSHYGEHVASFYVSKINETYGSSLCENESCHFLVYAFNNTTDTIVIEYSVFVEAGTMEVQSNGIATIPPLQYVRTDSTAKTTIQNPFGASFVSFNIDPGNISYH